MVAFALPVKAAMWVVSMLETPAYVGWPETADPAVSHLESMGRRIQQPFVTREALLGVAAGKHRRQPSPPIRPDAAVVAGGIAETIVRANPTLLRVIIVERVANRSPVAMRFHPTGVRPMTLTHRAIACSYTTQPAPVR